MIQKLLYLSAINIIFVCSRNFLWKVMEILCKDLKNSRSWTKGSHSMLTMLAIFHQQKQKLLQVSIIYSLAFQF